MERNGWVKKMKAFNENDLKNAKDKKIETTEWCIQATRDYFEAAVEAGTEPKTLNSRIKYASIASACNVSKEFRDFSLSLFKIRVVEFYVILLSSRFDNYILNLSHSISITLRGKRIYFDDHIASSDEVGKFIAKICNYNKDLAKELFMSALKSEPWDVAYTIQRAKEYENKTISITGNNNKISKGNIIDL